MSLLTTQFEKALANRQNVTGAALADVLGVTFREQIAPQDVSHEFVTLVPISFARRHRVIGLCGERGDVHIALCDLAGWPVAERVSKILNRPVRVVFSTPEAIQKAINAAYQRQDGQAQAVIDELDQDQAVAALQRAINNEDLLDVDDKAPVIKLVNKVLLDAVLQRASDVHVQPYEDRVVVRLRIDGILHDVYRPPKTVQEEIISRIKVMGGMNVAERRLAQDGRATVVVGDRLIDLRVSTLPTTFGERAVIRLLDKSARLYSLTELGMPPGVLAAFRRLIHLDHGLILVTGPTGSGKSTTLYAALQEINSTQLNIVTLEDPIEYRLPGISQTQVSDKKGMTFASGLRHVLRQDPDIIMIGEIRDSDTAHLAIQSALTGHLVLSTLHTNDAASAVARLLDLGVEPYLLASSLLGSLAQRLVRRICPHCRREHTPSEEELSTWGASREELAAGCFAGEGCPRCLNTGHRERLGVFELLTVTEPVRDMIHDRAKSSTIKTAAIADGMTTLRTDGLSKVHAGITTMTEVAKVAGRDEF